MIFSCTEKSDASVKWNHRITVLITIGRGFLDTENMACKLLFGEPSVLLWSICIWSFSADSFISIRALHLLGSVNWTYQIGRWVGWAWGSFNSFKITKHLLYYIGVCLFLLYEGAPPQLKLLRLGIKTAQLCIPFSLHVQSSYISSCLSLTSKSFMLSYLLSISLASFHISELPLLPFHSSVLWTFSVRPVRVYGHQKAILLFFLLCFFFSREMFWG